MWRFDSPLATVLCLGRRETQGSRDIERPREEISEVLEGAQLQFASLYKILWEILHRIVKRADIEIIAAIEGWSEMA